MKFLVAALATWRICRLLIVNAGPADVFVHYRTIVSAREATAPLAYCMECLSVWVGFLVTPIALSGFWWVLIPFALSAAAIWGDKHVSV